MRCPRCGVENRLDSPCIDCGQDLTVAREIEQFSQELKKASGEFQQVSARLISLQAKLESLPGLLILDRSPVTSSESPSATPQTLPHEPTIASEPPHVPFAAPVKPEVRQWAEAWVREDHSDSADKKTQQEGQYGTESESSHGDKCTIPEPPLFKSRVPEPEPTPFLDRAAELQLGQKWLLIVGIVVMVLGVGYFLKYAFDRNWIGPAGRVACAYGAGAACLLAGERFRRKGLSLFGLYLMGGGIAVLYFSGYAAFQIYDLITQSAAFSLMVAVTMLAGFLSLKFDIMWLAVLGIIGGFVTPVVLSTRQDNQIALMTYMAILNAGILWIAAYKRWQLLNQFGFFFTWGLFGTWFASHYDVSKFVRTIAFLNVFFVAYAIVPFAYYFVPRDQVQRPGFAITFINTIAAFGFSYKMIRDYASTEAVSIVSLGYGLLYLGMGLYLRRRNPANIDAFVMLMAMALLFFIITIPLYFSAHWITVAWGVQAAVLIWAALRIGDSRLYFGGFVLLFIVLARFIFHDTGRQFGLDLSRLAFTSGYYALAAQRWATSVTVLGSTFAVATILRRSSADDRFSNIVEARNLMYSIFGVLAFAVMNVEVAAWFFDYAISARFAAISVLWAICAITLMILGFWNDLVVLRRCSFVLFAATLLKVFLWDMAKVSTPYRIVSFLVLGLMLIGASYLYHRFKGRLDASTASEQN